MSRTVPQEAFSAEGFTRYVEQEESGTQLIQAVIGDVGPMSIERPSLGERLRDHGRKTSIPEVERFVLDHVLGIGSTGQVCAFHDFNLDRDVAVKFLENAARPSDIDDFVQEAKIAASLQHPNVLPVHDLDVNEAGQVYFTMKKVEGRSLGAVLEQSTIVQRAPPIETVNALVSVMIDVCQALAYAHHCGVVHQDIKPDNIMLGDFGEVLLVDWGSAVRLTPEAKPRLYGTPLYMSPEQARLEHVDGRTDIYSMGATLFHALTMRSPTWSPDPDVFWHRKRHGELDPLTPAERKAVPAPLLAIAIKALAPDAADRYQTVDQLRLDLVRYQEGLAVSAHQDSLTVALSRWYRRHARVAWTAAVVAMAALIIAGVIYGERIKELATWGSPELDETFASDHWKKDWTITSGDFAVVDGHLATTGPSECSMVYAHKLLGAFAIDYDCECLPDSHPGDMSLSYSREAVLSDDGTRAKALARPYFIQFGAFHGAYSAIVSVDGRHLAYDDFHPVPGRLHHVRVEIEGNRMAQIIDGRLVCEYFDPLPFTGGYIGFYCYYPKKAIEHIRIYARGVPEKVSATAIGDAFARAELYDRAEEEYQRVADSHPDAAIGREAIYKRGLCRWWQHRYNDASVIWEPLVGTDREDLVRLHKLDSLFESGDHSYLLSEMEHLYAVADAATRKRIAMQWADYVTRLMTANARALVERYADVHDRVFPHQTTADYTMGPCLQYLGRYEELLQRFPRQRALCAGTLVRMDRLIDVVNGFQDQTDMLAQAQMAIGRSSLIVAQDNPLMAAIGLTKRGHADQVLKSYPEQADAVKLALCALGRQDEILSRYPDDKAWCLRAMMLSGRANQITDPDLVPRARFTLGDPQPLLSTAKSESEPFVWARQLAGLQAWIQGNRDDARRQFAGLPPLHSFRSDVFFIGRFLAPFLEGLDGKFTAFDQACATIIEKNRWTIEQRPWNEAMFLAGRIDEAGFMKQEHVLYADADLLLCEGLRNERGAHPAEALASYRAYLALPFWRRGIDVDPVINQFVEWRVKTLSAPAP